MMHHLLAVLLLLLTVSNNVSLKFLNFAKRRSCESQIMCYYEFEIEVIRFQLNNSKLLILPTNR